ncbi:MAG: 4Fe-4S dicluster domain-containing protein [Candidatus Hodarchaeales archaeon]|jgi:Na+-translocating ferredoxin:NAD+ oxidoreductase RnfC subunit
MSSDIVEAVKEAGVVGAGGAGFPTHIKLAAKIDTYIANGAECEPLIHVDQHLMIKYPELVVRGLQLGMKSTGAKKGIIALKRKYSEAVKAIQKKIKGDSSLEVFLLDDFYPAGDEFVLVYETLHRLVPETGLPLDVGVVVNNIATLINIAKACEGEPVTTRHVTVTGEVKHPQTIEFPIGTSVEGAIHAAGGSKVKPYKVIAAAMMGDLISSPSINPITKTTSALIVLPEDHYLIRMKEQRMSSKVVVTKAACIRCQLCTEVCPRYMLGHDLYPDKVMRAVAFGGMEKPRHLTSTFLCVFCGACTYYGCPMGLDPCKINLEVRDNLMIEGMKNPHKRKNLQVHQERELRRLPMNRLVARLDLTKYEHPAPLSSTKAKVERVRIPLKQHIGTPALPTVSVGEKVSKGELIGKIPDESLGAAIHASISGTVEKITDFVEIREKI